MMKIGIRTDNISRDEFKASYEAARGEILSRIRIRTQILGLFVAASGTLGGILIKAPSVEFMPVMGFFSLAAALMVAHQDLCISMAAYHCKTNIKPSFGKRALWNNCAPAGGEACLKRWLRFASQAAIILFPVVLSFLYLLKIEFDGEVRRALGHGYVLFSFAIVAASVAILFVTTWYRGRQYAEAGD